MYFQLKEKLYYPSPSIYYLNIKMAETLTIHTETRQFGSFPKDHKIYSTRVVILHSKSEATFLTILIRQDFRFINNKEDPTKILPS